ncbi:MAG: hypothetical protein ACK45T_23805, partial [Pseudanabaena sp.]
GNPKGVSPFGKQAIVWQKSVSDFCHTIAISCFTQRSPLKRRNLVLRRKAKALRILRKGKINSINERD